MIDIYTILIRYKYTKSTISDNVSLTLILDNNSLNQLYSIRCRCALFLFQVLMFVPRAAYTARVRDSVESSSGLLVVKFHIPLHWWSTCIVDCPSYKDRMKHFNLRCSFSSRLLKGSTRMSNFSEKCGSSICLCVNMYLISNYKNHMKIRCR